jgi:hypothetical protein
MGPSVVALPTSEASDDDDMTKLYNYRQGIVNFPSYMITLVCSFLNVFRRFESFFSLCSLRSRTLSAETVIHLLIASSRFS